MFKRLALALGILASAALAQNVPQPLAVTRYLGLTSTTNPDSIGVLVIDNRSTFLRANNYHSFYVTGTGNYSIQMDYSDALAAGPYTSFGATALVDQTTNPAIGYANGYHAYIHFTITGTGAASVVIAYSASKDYFLSTTNGAAVFPIGVTQGGTGLTTATLNGVLFGNGLNPLGVTAAGSQYQTLQPGATGIPFFGPLVLGQAAATSGQLPISAGGTNGTTAATARSNLSAAVLGVNGDITQLTGLTTPLSVTEGGTAATTFAAHGPLVGQGTSAVVASGPGTLGQVYTSNGAGADPTFQALTVVATPYTVPIGGTGATTLTGVPIGTGTAALTGLAATNQLDFLRRKANQTSTTYEFASEPYLNVNDYNFPSQAPGGSLTAALGATVTLTPCPLGVAGADAGHYVYVSAGVGTAEAVLIAGGTCASGAASGTIIFTPANNHSGAWTVSSATAGIQEAILAASGKAVYVPAGIHQTYQTIANVAGVPMFGDGGGGGVTGGSRIDVQFDGHALTIGPAGGFVASLNIAISGIKVTYKNGAALGASGYGFVFQNVTNGTVSDVGVYGTYGGFNFNGSVGVQYDHMYAAVKLVGFLWANTNINNAGFFDSLYCTAQTAGAVCYSIQPTTTGLSLHNIFADGAAVMSYGIFFVPGAGGALNEINIDGGYLDGCALNCIVSTYSAAGSTNGILIKGLRMSATGAQPAVDIHYPLSNMKLSGNIISNTSTGGAVSFSGIRHSSLVDNLIEVNDAAGVPVGFVTSGGGTLNDDILVSDNQIGMTGVAPTTAVLSDGGLHTKIRASANKISGAITGFVAGSTAVFDESNEGLPIPALASAGTTYSNVNPVATVTGTTAISTITGGVKGRMLTLIFTDAAPAGVLTGGNITRAVSVVQNQAIQLVYDGTNWNVVSGDRNGGAGTVVAAGTMALPSGDLVTVTGNTGINTINTCDAAAAGKKVTLFFTGTPTVTDGSNLLMAGNLVATANDTLSLQCNGTNWAETGRSVN